MDKENNKFCVDCKYYVKFRFDEQLSDCIHPYVPVDKITGKKQFASCNSQRLWNFEYDCGKEGKYWEPKEERKIITWLKKLF